MELGIIYILAMSSISVVGIILAGLMISPPSMRVLCKKKLGKFQEKLVKVNLKQSIVLFS